ncbi:MAG: helix-turn-helix transcriptional regulator [Bifidobacteriales bacterium]|nr:helix-turn-helix transcriptional regulator [Bifidobacteriales bacterium]
MESYTLSQTVASRLRAVMGAQRIRVAELSRVWGQSVDMTSRRLNGDVEIRLGEIGVFAKLTGYRPEDFLAERFEVKSDTLSPPSVQRIGI